MGDISRVGEKRENVGEEWGIWREIKEREGEGKDGWERRYWERRGIGTKGGKRAGVGKDEVEKNGKIWKGGRLGWKEMAKVMKGGKEKVGKMTEE